RITLRYPLRDMIDGMCIFIPSPNNDSSSVTCSWVNANRKVFALGVGAIITRFGTVVTKRRKRGIKDEFAEPISANKWAINVISTGLKELVQRFGRLYMRIGKTIPIVTTPTLILVWLGPNLIELTSRNFRNRTSKNENTTTMNVVITQCWWKNPINE